MQPPCGTPALGTSPRDAGLGSTSGAAGRMAASAPSAGPGRADGEATGSKVAQGLLTCPSCSPLCPWPDVSHPPAKNGGWRHRELGGMCSNGGPRAWDRDTLLGRKDPQLVTPSLPPRELREAGGGGRDPALPDLSAWNGPTCAGERSAGAAVLQATPTSGTQTPRFPERVAPGPRGRPTSRLPAFETWPHGGPPPPPQPGPGPLAPQPLPPAPAHPAHVPARAHLPAQPGCPARPCRP